MQVHEEKPLLCLFASLNVFSFIEGKSVMSGYYMTNAGLDTGDGKLKICSSPCPWEIYDLVGNPADNSPCQYWSRPRVG